MEEKLKIQNQRQEIIFQIQIPQITTAQTHQSSWNIQILGTRRDWCSRFGGMRWRGVVYIPIAYLHTATYTHIVQMLTVAQWPNTNFKWVILNWNTMHGCRDTRKVFSLPGSICAANRWVFITYTSKLLRLPTLPDRIFWTGVLGGGVGLLSCPVKMSEHNVSRLLYICCAAIYRLERARKRGWKPQTQSHVEKADVSHFWWTED